MTELLQALGPLWEIARQYPLLAGPLVVLVLVVAIGSSILTALVSATKIAASMPKEGADTLRLRAEAAKAEAEAQKYRAEAESIEAESSRETIERLSVQVDRLARENDRLIAEGDKVLERLGACQRTSKRLEAQFASLEERCRLLIEWIEAQGGDVAEILDGRVS
jgi:chromosome segregation ATPase